MSQCLVLFDTDGCTGVIPTSKLCIDARKGGQYEFMYRGKLHLVEVLEKSDNIDDLNCFERSWQVSTRASLLSMRKELSEGKLGGFLSCLPACPVEQKMQPVVQLKRPEAEVRAVERSINGDSVSKPRKSKPGKQIQKAVARCAKTIHAKMKSIPVRLSRKTRERASAGEQNGQSAKESTHVSAKKRKATEVTAKGNKKKMGSNGRCITVEFSGEIEREQAGSSPKRQPVFLDHLSEDQSETVTAEINFFKRNMESTGTQTEPVLILSCNEEIKDFEKNRKWLEVLETVKEIHRVVLLPTKEKSAPTTTLNEDDTPIRSEELEPSALSPVSSVHSSLPAQVNQNPVLISPVSTALDLTLKKDLVSVAAAPINSVQTSLLAPGTSIQSSAIGTSTCYIPTPETEAMDLTLKISVPPTIPVCNSLHLSSSTDYLPVNQPTLQTFTPAFNWSGTPTHVSHSSLLQTTPVVNSQVVNRSTLTQLKPPAAPTSICSTIASASPAAPQSSAGKVPLLQMTTPVSVVPSKLYETVQTSTEKLSSGGHQTDMLDVTSNELVSSLNAVIKASEEHFSSDLGNDIYINEEVPCDIMTATPLRPTNPMHFSNDTLPRNPLLQISTNSVRDIKSHEDMIGVHPSAQIRVDQQTKHQLLMKYGHSVSMFAWKLAQTVFSEDEMYNKNFHGRGKPSLSPRRKKLVQDTVTEYFNSSDNLRQAVDGINSGIRSLRRKRLSQLSSRL